MSTGGQGTKCCIKIAENFNRLSRVHERYRQTTDRQTDGRPHIGSLKLVKHQYLLHASSQYGELRPTSGWDRFVSLGHPSKFQRLSRLGSVTARHLCLKKVPTV